MRITYSKWTALAPLFALVASTATVATASEDKYQKYEKKVAAAQRIADRATKKGNSQNIAAAYYQLAKIRSEARRNQVTCDVAYLSDLISNIQTVVDHSTWFQKNLTGLSIYRDHSSESLSLHLMAAGLVKNKSFTTAEFAAAVQNAIATSTFELYKPVPGVLPLGSVTFSKGTAIDHSLLLTEDRNIKWIDSSPVPASVSIVDGRVTLLLDGRAVYTIKIMRNETEVLGTVRSTDGLLIEGLDSSGNPTSDYIDQLFVAPDECSA